MRLLHTFAPFSDRSTLIPSIDLRPGTPGRGWRSATAAGPAARRPAAESRPARGRAGCQGALRVRAAWYFVLIQPRTSPPKICKIFEKCIFRKMHFSKMQFRKVAPHPPFLLSQRKPASRARRAVLKGRVHDEVQEIPAELLRPRDALQEHRDLVKDTNE